jgi:hypothetical protein
VVVISTEVLLATKTQLPMNTPMRFLLTAGVAVSGVLATALPSLAHAATYAFVNQSGYVSSVSADNWMAAISNATNIDIHSGVMLLNAQSDYNVVGNFLASK